MEAYANALLFAVPIFMLLVLVEIFYGHLKGKQTYTFMDTISSLSSGLTNIIKDCIWTRGKNEDSIDYRRDRAGWLISCRPTVR